jgi:hypothetical protein
MALAWPGVAGQTWRGQARRGLAWRRHGMARRGPGMAGQIWLGGARKVRTRQGVADAAGQTWRGRPRLGLARRGMAAARPGEAGQTRRAKRSARIRKMIASLQQ